VDDNIVRIINRRIVQNEPFWVPAYPGQVAFVVARENDGHFPTGLGLPSILAIDGDMNATAGFDDGHQQF